MKLAIFLRELGQPVAYYPKLAQVTGGVLANLFLCQMYYWQGKQEDPAGWIYKTQAEIETETGLSRYEQETARKLLRQRSLLKERYKGLPRRLEFWLSEDELENRWAFFLQYQGEKPFVTDTKPSQSNRKSNSKRKPPKEQAAVSRKRALEIPIYKDSSIMLDDNIIECGLTSNNNAVTPHTSLLENHIQFCGNPTGLPVTIQHASLRESNMQVCGNPTGNLYPEITPETTSEITLPPIPPRGKQSVGKENLTRQPENPGTGNQPPSLTNLSNQPDSQLQPLNPHEEQSAAISLVGSKAMQLNGIGRKKVKSLAGNKAMKLEKVEKNELELTPLLEFRQNFELAISQKDKYSAPAAIETKIAAPQTTQPASFSNQPELSRVEPNNFRPAEHDAVLPTTKITAIEHNPTSLNPSQEQTAARLQTDSRFHPRSVASWEEENRFDRNQAELPKNLDGSDRLPWDTNKRGVFDQAFENHMARSLMQYPAYRDLMAGELLTKVRKHISAGRYDLKRRDELLIEWSAMHDHTRNDFSTTSSTLTAKGAARRAKIARALNMKDYS